MQIREEDTKQKEILVGEAFDKRRATDLETNLNEARAQATVSQSIVQQFMKQAVSLGERQDTQR